MIPVEEAQTRVLAMARPLPAEDLPLPQAIKTITELGAHPKRVCVCTDDRDADQMVSLRDPDAELVADGWFIVPVVRGDELACCFEVDGHDP